MTDHVFENLKRAAIIQGLLRLLSPVDVCSNVNRHFARAIRCCRTEQHFRTTVLVRPLSVSSCSQPPLVCLSVRRCLSTAPHTPQFYLVPSPYKRHPRPLSFRLSRPHPVFVHAQLSFHFALCLAELFCPSLFPFRPFLFSFHLPLASRHHAAA